MNQTSLMAVAVAGALTSACGSAVGLGFQPSYGIVVKYEALPGATTKYGVNALSDSGRRLFGPAALGAPAKLGFGGGTSSYGGGAVPKWVRVTWRTPIPGHFTATSGKVVETLDFGEVIGDYKVEVADRIPPEVLEYASGRGRAIINGMTYDCLARPY